MTLRGYMRLHGLNPSQFARQVGVDPSVIHRWLGSGNSRIMVPSPANMAKVIRATGGDVSANDLLGIGSPLPRRKRAAHATPGEAV